MDRVELEISEIKNIALKGLLWLSHICDVNNINYYLAYGTLLGAVRHQGFVPWDDDIDIWMTRENYNKFVNLNVVDNEWEIMSCETNEEYYFPWAKLCNKCTVLEPSRFTSGLLYGVSIDIFPLDASLGLSFEEMKASAMKLRNEYKRLQKKFRPFTGGSEGLDTLFKRIFKRLYCCVAEKIYGSPNKALKQLIEKQNYSSMTNSDYLFCVLAPVAGFWEKIDFQDTAMLEFEGHYFPAPVGYDNVLRAFYGDYMTLPPVDKRVTHHSFTAYYI